jgi:hypothetical protein
LFAELASISIGKLYPEIATQVVDRKNIESIAQLACLRDTVLLEHDILKPEQKDAVLKSLSKKLVKVAMMYGSGTECVNITAGTCRVHLTDNDRIEHFTSAISALLSNGLYVTPRINEDAQEEEKRVNALLEIFTNKQKGVLAHIHRKPRDIATLLSVDPNTISKYKNDIKHLMKIHYGIDNYVDIEKWARSNRLIRD